MTNQQKIANNPPAEIPLAQRTYAFKDLPKDAQEKLLEMQNTDGDFLKISSGETERTVGLFVLWITIFVGFAAVVADSLLDLKRIVVFSADGFLLLFWFVYLVRKLFKTFSASLKNRVYLTPKQVIEIHDGMVRYRQLKDAAEISVNQFWSNMGRRNSLDVKFADGDAYRFYVPGMANSNHFALMGEWREKAAAWQNEAVGAVQRGDTDYLKSRDVFSNITESNTPFLQRQDRTRKENLLLISTIVLLALNGSFIFYLTK